MKQRMNIDYISFVFMIGFLSLIAAGLWSFFIIDRLSVNEPVCNLICQLPLITGFIWLGIIFSPTTNIQQFILVRAPIKLLFAGLLAFSLTRLMDLNPELLLQYFHN